MKFALNILYGIGRFFRAIWNWFWKLSKTGKIIVGVILVVLIAAGIYFYQRHRIAQLEEENRQGELNLELQKTEETRKKLEEQEQKANAAGVNSQKKEQEFDESKKKDSNSASGNQQQTDDNYCRRYCNDSSCAEWRKTHPCG